MTFFNLCAFFNKYLLIMGIGTEINLIMFNDNKVAITTQTTTAINHYTIGGSIDRLTLLAGDIKPLVCRGKALN